MKSHKECNADILTLLLRDYFPGLIFIPKNNTGNLTILNYVLEKNGKWILDLKAMSKCKEKHFTCLFPKNISLWDEEKARKKYGCADVIRYFIDVENDKFWLEFSKIKNAEFANVDKHYIPENFFIEMDKRTENYNGKPVWEDWNFSGFILHKLRHNPPGIYEAFDYYGHRNYTLWVFGLDKLCSENCGNIELLKNGRKLLEESIQEHFPEMANAAIERKIAFFELVQEILEGTSAGKSIYALPDIDFFIKQLKSRSYGLYKKNNDIDYSETYNSSERKTINNHIEKIGHFVEDEDSHSELRKLKLNGIYLEKINFLHRLIMTPSIRDHYSERELAIIHGLFLKQFQSMSLDRQLIDGDDDNSYTGYDIISDEKYLLPDDRFVWMSFFKNIFEREFDEPRLENFLECLPDHFARFPFQIDSDGNYKMSKYSKQMLFSTFCSVAGIAQDIELWKPFLVLLQQVIDNINRS